MDTHGILNLPDTSITSNQIGKQTGWKAITTREWQKIRTSPMFINEATDGAREPATVLLASYSIAFEFQDMQFFDSYTTTVSCRAVSTSCEITQPSYRVEHSDSPI